jgi:hypothetical protein
MIEMIVVKRLATLTRVADLINVPSLLARRTLRQKLIAAGDYAWEPNKELGSERGAFRPRQKLWITIETLWK